MSTHFSAAPNPDDLEDRIPGTVDPDRGHGLDGEHTHPILCCGTTYTTARAFWEHYFDNHDE